MHGLRAQWRAAAEVSLLGRLRSGHLQILLASAGVSFGLAYFDEESQHEGWRAYVEPFVIVLILILNAAVGVWQESRSEAALEALKELQSEHARVLRGGRIVSLCRWFSPSCVLQRGGRGQTRRTPRPPRVPRRYQSCRRGTWCPAT